MPEGNAFAGLRLPAIAAPMFLVSGPELVVASARSGIVGAMPAANARTGDDLDRWCRTIRETLAGDCPRSWSINLVANRRNPRVEHDLGVIRRHEVPLVVTALGSPAAVIEAVHSYGGLVFHDVINQRHARKAAGAGVDGLILVCAGAGGHAGRLSPFALVGSVRKWFDGLILLGGAISDGDHILAARALGADLAYVGTRFLATHEANVQSEYKQAVIDADTEGVVYTDLFSGVHANYLKSSVRRAGYDPDNLPSKGEHGENFGSESMHKSKVWRDIWSAGQGVGSIDSIQPTALVVETMRYQYEKAKAVLI